MQPPHEKDGDNDDSEEDEARLSSCGPVNIAGRFLAGDNVNVVDVLPKGAVGLAQMQTLFLKRVLEETSLSASTMERLFDVAHPEGVGTYEMGAKMAIRSTWPFAALLLGLCETFG